MRIGEILKTLRATARGISGGSELRMQKIDATDDTETYTLQLDLLSAGDRFRQFRVVGKLHWRALRP